MTIYVKKEETEEKEKIIKTQCPLTQTCLRNQNSWWLASSEDKMQEMFGDESCN